MLLYNFAFPNDDSDSVSELYLRKKGNVTVKRLLSKTEKLPLTPILTRFLQINILFTAF